jgi:hypothetical protein
VFYAVRLIHFVKFCFSQEVNLKKSLVISMTLLALSTGVMAQDEPCNPVYENCSGQSAPQSHLDIYPFVPVATQHIFDRVAALTESQTFLWDIFEMERRGLTKGRSRQQPWGGSYWPMNQGMIANNYQDKDTTTFVLTFMENVIWKRNHRNYLSRAKKVHPKIYSLSEKDLAKLAPSEKYDILLGDTTFNLTNKMWEYTQRWGEYKKWGFLSSIDLPDGFRIPEGSKFMAWWEGICHGWAVAAGHTPRAEKTVWVSLPNGKRMPFYPNDIKALVSLLWANSTVQDSIIMEGLRCNKKFPATDQYGRYIDTEIDKRDDTFLPRCADVHPAIFHTALTTIMGIEGRSFVVDKSATASVANQPVSSYEFVFYNPKNGKDGTLRQAMLRVEDYEKDPFKSARNRETTHIVGVDMKLVYVDWEFPRLATSNSEQDDKLGLMDFNYDLELNQHGQIIGGQWRVKRDGKAAIIGGSTSQPDFFWVVPKDWKSHFQPIAGLPEWNFQRSSLPPMEYKQAALNAHSFIYNVTREFGFNEECEVIPTRRNRGERIKVPCEFRYPRPQPLLQVVDKLLEMSRN